MSTFIPICPMYRSQGQPIMALILKSITYFSNNYLFINFCYHYFVIGDNSSPIVYYLLIDIIPLQRLIKANSLQSIKQALSCKTKDPGIPELLHFIYKARSTGQFIESDPACPYDTEEEKERLFSIFRYVFCLMHTPGRRLKIYYHSGDKEAVLGWVSAYLSLR